MKQIVTSILDNDLYTFTCMYYILQKYPHAQVGYTFFDRNRYKYPKGFAELLQEQVNGMANIKMTDEEAAFMERKCYFIPSWFWTLLKGYRFDPSEVHISQDEEGYLSVEIEGDWWRGIVWEMPILSTISELAHILNGDIDKIEPEMEYKRSFAKCKKLITNSVVFSDMGTRRRCSYETQDILLKAFKDCSEKYVDAPGKFVGTSNCHFAMKYDLTPIGTMSHQIISFEEIMSGVFECNFSVMKNWSDVYGGNLGIMLYDCFGDDVFFKNISSKYAKLFSGLRVDSGDNMEQLSKIVAMYENFNINPQTKQVIFSNGLSIDKAIQIHKEVDGRVDDSMGIGTAFCCGFEEFGHVPSLDIKPMNIVIKLTKGRYSKNREWHDCIKLSCDKGKTLGNSEKCHFLQKQLGMIE